MDKVNRIVPHPVTTAAYLARDLNRETELLQNQDANGRSKTLGVVIEIGGMNVGEIVDEIARQIAISEIDLP